MASKYNYYEVGTIRHQEEGKWPDDSVKPAKNYIAFSVEKKAGVRDTSGIQTLINQLQQLVADPNMKTVCLDYEDPDVKPKNLAKLGYLDEAKLQEELANIPKWKLKTIKLKALK